MMLRGSQINNSPVAILFFSKDNQHRLQQKIKQSVLKMSQSKFNLVVDQDPMNLLLSMRYVYLEKSKDLPDKIVHQVKLLNEQTLNFIMPDIMSNIKQYYGYLQEINNPVEQLPRPININAKGRKTLPSITTQWTL